jgi:hypothetical protein
VGANVRLMRGIRLVGLARAYSDMPAASIGRSPRSDAGHPVLDQADFSGQPLDLLTNPASVEAGLRQIARLLGVALDPPPRTLTRLRCKVIAYMKNLVSFPLINSPWVWLSKSARSSPGCLEPFYWCESE